MMPVQEHITPLLGMTLQELEAVALSCSLKRFVGKQLADWIYKKRVSSFEEMTNISATAKRTLAERYEVGRHPFLTRAVSQDGTMKFLFQVSSHSAGSATQFVETVYIPTDDHATLCISTQAGCRMGCRFCMTGTLGFHGNLSAADMLNQILAFPDITNIVVMGEGEPMDNVSAVLRMTEIMCADYGCGWSPHRITVSTVGAGDGLERYLNESECNLAVSLHNPFAEERALIMPAEKLRPLSELLEILKQYDFRHQRRLSFEYIVWSGKNDTPRHARELVKILRPFAPQCRLNLIRFHAGVDRAFPATEEQSLQWFADFMEKSGIVTTIRRSRGEDILAACGMLANSLKSEM